MPPASQLPYLDSISFRVIEDSEIAVEALQAGDVDVVTTSNGRAISTIQGLGDEFSVTLQDDYVETYYLLIDLDKPGPLQDRRVRCAMSMAIDRQEFIDATSNGFDQVANGLFSPGQQGYLEDNGLSRGAGSRRRRRADRRVRGGDRDRRRVHPRTHAVERRRPGCRAADGLVVGRSASTSTTATIPQSDFINLADLRRRPSSRCSCGASTPACSSTSSTCGGTPRTPSPTAAVAELRPRCAIPTSTPASTRPASRRPTRRRPPPPRTSTGCSPSSATTSPSPGCRGRSLSDPGSAGHR